MASLCERLAFSLSVICLFSQIDVAKVQHSHCGSRRPAEKFFFFRCFFAGHTSTISNYANIQPIISGYTERVDAVVAVLQFSQSHSPSSKYLSIFIYIYIYKDRANFIPFPLSVLELQHCNAATVRAESFCGS